MIVILVTLIYISLYSVDLYMQIFCKAYYHRPEF